MQQLLLAAIQIKEKNKMEKAIQGLKQVLYVGLVEERGKVEGRRLALQITHSLKKNKKVIRLPQKTVIL